MFKEASIYSPAADDDGLRVLVMRQWPRGVRKDKIDVWLKEAAPSRDLLKAYHDGLSWDEFERRYREEILSQRPEVLDKLRSLWAEHHSVTLLCFERVPPAEHCHRFVLMDILGSS